MHDTRRLRPAQVWSIREGARISAFVSLTHSHRQTRWQRDREVQSQTITDRHTDRQRGSHRHTQTHTDTDTDTDTHTHTDTQTQTHRCRGNLEKLGKQMLQNAKRVFKALGNPNKSKAAFQIPQRALICSTAWGHTVFAVPTEELRHDICMCVARKRALACALHALVDGPVRALAQFCSNLIAAAVRACACIIILRCAPPGQESTTVRVGG